MNDAYDAMGREASNDFYRRLMSILDRFRNGLFLLLWMLSSALVVIAIAIALTWQVVAHLLDHEVRRPTARAYGPSASGQNDVDDLDHILTSGVAVSIEDAWRCCAAADNAGEVDLIRHFRLYDRRAAGLVYRSKTPDETSVARRSRFSRTGGCRTGGAGCKKCSSSTGRSCSSVSTMTAARRLVPLRLYGRVILPLEMDPRCGYGHGRSLTWILGFQGRALSPGLHRVRHRPRRTFHPVRDGRCR